MRILSATTATSLLSLTFFITSARSESGTLTAQLRQYTFSAAEDDEQVGKVCPEQERTYLTCLITNQFNEFNECLTCLNEQWPVGDELFCHDLEGYLCDAPVSCPCDPCVEEITAFYDCYYYFCDRNELCSDETASPTTTPPTLEPTEIFVPSEADCAEQVGSVTSCVDGCVAQERRRLSAEPQPDEPHLLLRGKQQPPFHQSRHLYETSLAVNTKDRDAALTESKCSSEQTAYLQCFVLELSGNQMNECTSCLNDSLPTGTIIQSCAAVEDFLCHAPYDCNCGACIEEIQAFNDCWYTFCDRQELCGAAPEVSPQCSHEVAPIKTCVDACFAEA